MKSAIWDVETSALEAIGAGFLICSVVKEEGGDELVFRYDEYHCRPAHEKRMVKDLLDCIASFDLVVGHNIYRFDWNYLKSRAQVFGLPIPRYPLVYDTLQAFRRCGFLTRPNSFGKPTASLDMISDFLGIKQEKTKIYPREHWKTVWESGLERKKAIDNLVDHCSRDTRMTERVYRTLLELDGMALIRRLK